MSKKENEYQKKVIEKLEAMFPNAIILKNDPTYLQGVPDITIFNNNKWATLEAKRSKDAEHQPNQDYYVDRMNAMSYSSFIYPENEKEVFDDLEKALH